MATIIYIQADGTQQRVEARVGSSLMQAAIRAGVAGIDAKCRGGCACVTCHVFIDPAWRLAFAEPSAMEESMLDFADGVDDRSRLSCQVRVNAACEGMIVRIPAEQRTLGL